MAGYLLGTGSGVLAAAAVYYGLSTSISRTANSLQDEVERSSQLLNSSFDPQAPPAPSSFVGPSYPNEPRFSDTLRSRWNLALSRAVDNVRETDWANVGLVIVDETRNLASKAISTASNASSSSSPPTSTVTASTGSKGNSIMAEGARLIAGGASDVGEKLLESGEEAKGTLKGWWSSAKGAVQDAERGAERFTDAVERGMDDERHGTEPDIAVGFIGGDLREESFTGGSEGWVKAKREVERSGEGRLV